MPSQPTAPSANALLLQPLAAAVEALERMVAPAVAWPDIEMHGYEPFDADIFAAELAIAIEHAADVTFLEVGCGIGTKVLIAAKAGLEATGLEIRPLYATIARELTGQEIILGDARGFDEYGSFAIVYSYKPLINEEAQQDLETEMSRQMRDDAVWISPRRDMAWLGWNKVGDHTWIRA